MEGNRKITSGNEIHSSLASDKPNTKTTINMHKINIFNLSNVPVAKSITGLAVIYDGVTL